MGGGEREAFGARVCVVELYYEINRLSLASLIHFRLEHTMEDAGFALCYLVCGLIEAVKVDHLRRLRLQAR